MKENPFRRERLADRLRITYTWRTAAAYGMLFFAIVWNGMIAFFLMTGAGWPVVFHLLVGLFLIWYVVALFLNRSVIEATERELRVTHSPVPTWTRNRTIPVADLRQLYLSCSGSRTTGNREVELWALRARLAGGNTVGLLNPVADKAALEEVERDLEAYLRIQDTPREDVLELPDLSRLREILPSAVPRSVDGAVRQAGRAGNRAHPSHTLPAPGPFLLYRARPGEQFSLRGREYQLVANHEIEWTDAHHPSARVITASGAEAHRQVYAELIRGRWSYFEERPLDAEERERLGFTLQAAHPYSLRNGQDRYYPGSLQEGTYKDGPQAGERLEQYTYLTTRSSTRFRASRVIGGPWRVTVQEPVDGGSFARLS